MYLGEESPLIHFTGRFKEYKNNENVLLWIAKGSRHAGSRCYNTTK